MIANWLKFASDNLTEKKESATIDISLINNINIDMEKWIQKFKPKTKEELLALDIASVLYDIENLALYISYCKKFPEVLIRKTAAEVKQIPDEKIRKSRGALFNYLIQKNGRQNYQQNTRY